MLLGGVNVGNADGDVIHDSAKSLISIRLDVDHEFEPVCSVGNLHRDPVGLVVLHAAVPVGAEAENVFVKVLCGGTVADDEAGVNDFVFVPALSQNGDNLGVFKHTIGFEETDFVTFRIGQ